MSVLNSFANQFLSARGYDTPEKAEAFLNFPGPALRMPEDLIGGSELVSRLADAVRNGLVITVYGDYDADGIMAVSIFSAALTRLIPGRIHTFINNRFEDGYAMTSASVQRMLGQFPDTQVILTCDNGISSGEAIAYAMEQGIQVLVTDHHEQALPVPEGCPVLDEKSFAQKEADAASGDEPDLCCGAEMARRVCVSLYRLLGIEEENASLLDSLYAFSAFATITDAVPMNAPNHYVARRGLSLIRKGDGFWGLLQEESGLAGRPVDGETVGFKYGPMINAAGRVTGSAAYPLHAILLYFRGKLPACREAIRKLISFNEVRKDMCVHDDGIALRAIERRSMEEDPFIFLYDDRFSEGINGLTAAHLVEKFRVPCAVLAPTKKDPDIYKGSARSVEPFDLFKALSSHPEKIRSGGHPMAAGLSVHKHDLEEVRRLLIEDASAFTFEAPPVKPADVTFSPDELSAEVAAQLAEAIELLMPFGPGFEKPRIALVPGACRLFALRGRDGSDRHAKFLLDARSRDGLSIEAIWWNHLEEARALENSKEELIFFGTPEVNQFNGSTRIQFIIQEAYAKGDMTL